MNKLIKSFVLGAQGLFCGTDQERDRSVILVASENVGLLLWVRCLQAPGDVNRKQKEGSGEKASDENNDRIVSSTGLYCLSCLQVLRNRSELKTLRPTLRDRCGKFRSSKSSQGA
jgi:hypothetical protein